MPVPELVSPVERDTIDDIKTRLGNPAGVEAEDARKLVAEILRLDSIRDKKQREAHREREDDTLEAHSVNLASHAGRQPGNRYIRAKSHLLLGILGSELVVGADE